ncbi:MAG: hypothetical protein IPI40_03435 [Betaproteobacteria bacterium]|nr:hypothetical protein [Betaproteobacteria bacterium]
MNDPYPPVAIAWLTGRCAPIRRHTPNSSSKKKLAMTATPDHRDDLQQKNLVRGAAIARLLALEPLRSFNKRVPPIDERDHEDVHAQVSGSVLVHGRLVTEGEAEVIVDVVAQRQPERDVVALVSP